VTLSEPVRSMPFTDLHVVAIVADAHTIELMERVIVGSFDRLTVATDLAEGLARAASEVPDLVFVDVTLGKNAGLAVVHHLRAVSPGVQVYALARAEHLAIGAQAVALGGAGVLVMPLSGDELLTAMADVRTRRAEREERLRLERQNAASNRAASVVARIAEIADARNRREGAERLAEVLVQGAGAKLALIYLPAGEGSRQLMRAAMLGEAADAPSFCDDMEVLGYASERGLEVVRLTVQREHYGLVLLGGLPHRVDEEPLPLVELVATQAATALALIGEREKSNRGAMKDPSSRAYTFAYFVDVAGREIDKARRHKRRFALATLTVEIDSQALPRVDVAIDDPLPSSELTTSEREPSVETAERVLGVVRDTDVLARVDEHEFYLLLPETGGMGAHTCRRRILRQLGGLGGVRRSDGGGFALTMGVATFPHDGGDLSQLLRVAKHRAEVSSGSVVRRLGLERMTLSDVVDSLFWSVSDPASRKDHGIEWPRSIELPVMDLAGLAIGAVNDALRGGSVRVVASLRSGMCVGSAVRSALGIDRDDVRCDLVDVTGVPSCDDLEVLCMVAEHGAYVLLGRAERHLVRAVHTADPVLADLVMQRLGEAAGMRLVD
jgi:DNA-binding response OmpR family regulator